MISKAAYCGLGLGLNLLPVGFGPHGIGSGRTAVMGHATGIEELLGLEAVVFRLHRS